MSERTRPMRSGELSALTGVSADTLRHYESKGLLPAPRRGSNGYRLYAPEAADRVRAIQRALDMGFSLDELAGVFRQRDRGGAPCRQVHAIATARLAELERRIERLVHLRDELHTLLRDWDRRLERLPAGARAGLLEELPELPREAGRRRWEARNRP